MRETNVIGGSSKPTDKVHPSLFFLKHSSHFETMFRVLLICIYFRGTTGNATTNTAKPTNQILPTAASAASFSAAAVAISATKTKAAAMAAISNAIVYTTSTVPGFAGVE